MACRYRGCLDLGGVTLEPVNFWLIFYNAGCDEGDGWSHPCLFLPENGGMKHADDRQVFPREACFLHIQDQARLSTRVRPKSFTMQAGRLLFPVSENFTIFLFF